VNKDKPVLLFRPRATADKSFYDGYDPGFILNKASLLMAACKHPNELKAFVAATEGNPDELDASVFQSFVSELHFSVLHQFEVLFALMLAEFQPLPHWVYLTEYQTRDIKKKAQGYLDHDYDLVSAGVCHNQFDLIARAVYPGVVPMTDIEPNLRDSIADIGWLIEAGAKRYLSSPEYNAYKHGLRVIPGAMTLMVGLGAERSDFTPVISMASKITYLEREVLEEGVGYTEVTKEVSADDAYQWVLAMASVAEAITAIRLARLRRVPVQLRTFAIDREGLTMLRPVANFRMSL
jgi:hypothetical protein